MDSTMRAVEIITRVERRRRWSREEKQRLVAETARSDRTVSQVARTHGIRPNQLFTWRRQFLAAALDETGAGTGFVPVRLTAGSPPADAPAVPPSPALHTTSGGGSIAPRIEIALTSGVSVSVIGEVAPETLRHVLAALLPQHVCRSSGEGR